jgi:threonine dehydratase
LAGVGDGQPRNQHIGRLVLPIMQSLVREIVTVSDDKLREQMRFFIEQMRLVAEPTGCLAAAALTVGTLDLSGARVGVIVTGSNVANHVLSDALGPMQESVTAGIQILPEYGPPPAIDVRQAGFSLRTTHLKLKRLKI